MRLAPTSLAGVVLVQSSMGHTHDFRAPQVPACLDIGRPQFQVRMQDVTYDHQAPYCNSIASA